MVSPVIHFDGQCEEAISLYKKAFDVNVKEIHYYNDAPEGSLLKEMKDKSEQIMHSIIDIQGTSFNMSDAEDGVTKGDMICFNVFLGSEEDVKRAYEVLSREGDVIHELSEQFFAKLFTAITDKYGIRWQIMFIG